MKIVDIKTMKGPNYWSVRRHNLTVMVLDLEEMEQFPTNKIDGFGERLEAMFPSMYSHRCSVGCEGGFFQRVKEGTWMGHVIEHIALEIQTLAGMDCGFGRTRGYGEEGVYFVVFNHMVGKVGEYAAKASFRIAEALIANKEYDLDEDIMNMKEIRQNEGLGPSTSSIIKEAEARGIPWIRLNKYSLCQLGYGANQKRIQATVTSETSNIGVEIACDKEETKDLLEQAEVPIPKGDIIRTERGLKEAVDYVGFPLVIKPVNGNHGRGITTNINSLDEALIGFKEAKEVSRLVIVEKYITGEDHRLLVINNKLVAAAKRTPAHVIGDGKSTIQELVDEVNKDERRGYGHEKVLTEIDINSLTLEILKEMDMTTESVPKKGEMVKLKSTANLSTGGTAEDITELIHPYNVFMAERISKIIGLDICGIDIMAEDLTKPLNKSGGAVLEVNAGPGFRMHLQPTSGLPRNVGGHVVDMLFPPGSNSRIPIIAVTGTNGKTTTTRLIAHIAKMKGKKVGYTTSDGVYIQNRLLMTGDCTGPKSAEFVLKDPTVNFAVLECARGGLLRAGLGFKKCDIGVVTNVAGDHLGLKGIHTIDQLAKVKGVIPETVHKDGYSVLNADDDRVYAMRNNIESQFALFSMDEQNPRIKRHSSRGGISAVYENGYITIYRGEWKMRVAQAVNVPLTKGGKASFMIQNVLAGVLSCYLHGFSIEDIKVAIETFIPSPSQTPGRLNMFNFNKFDVLLDYAHNPAGLRALHKYVEKLDGHPKIGIVAGVGDRRKQDNFELGQISAEMFDEIIIRTDRNLRGKDEQELIDEIKAGILDVSPKIPLRIIKKENEAIQHAVENAKEGSLIVVSSDVVPDALNMVMNLKEKETKSLYGNVKEEIPNLEIQ
ncbi:MAG: cyanophycin synthetase [Bacteroidota bacterium]|nr:cyanophycin synthetase [Bacteroidota bacterium]MEC7083936.1 cyanophycin synthetase [Bacteroidota bacterium]MEC7617884.1 cyanophycin synthetase [Bacteroidota bacterium]MEC7944591.1 cyanophycin synthetase [Bacteroidota bacterium]MEC8004589.1 cyanophycin synthetase [Bacteroidota bacterium]